MKATCCVTQTRGIPAVELNGANECEHCRHRPETDSLDIIIGLRRLLQQYQYYCALEYDLMNCPLKARACKMKIEFDGNASDIKSICILELGTSDIEFIYDDGGDCGSSDDYELDDDFDVRYP
jgi:hypothetical protein